MPKPAPPAPMSSSPFEGVGPRRSLQGTASPEPSASALKAIKKTYTTKSYVLKGPTWSALVEAGLRAPSDAVKKDKRLLAATKEAHALLQDPTLEKVVAASLEALAVSERILEHVSRATRLSLISTVAEARGLADAIDVTLDAREIGADSRNYTELVWFVRVKPELSYRSYLASPLTLRHAICAAPAKPYAAARARAEDLRKRRPQTRVALAYAFPDESWATEELRRRMKEVPKDDDDEGENLDDLLSATSDASVVLAWLERSGWRAVSTYARDLAHVLPAKEAVSILRKGLAASLIKPKYGPLLKTPPREIAQALGIVNTTDAATTLAAYATHPILAPTVLAWFRENPKHAAVLKGEAKGKKKLEAAASRVLGTKGKGSVAVAKPSELPAVLRDAPWRSLANAKAAPVVIDRLAMKGLHLEKVVLVGEGRPFRHDGKAPIRPMTKAEIAEWKKQVLAGKYAQADYEYEHAKGGSGGEYRAVPAELGLWSWNERGTYLSAGALAWVKKHGLATIPGFLPEHRDWLKWLSYDGELEYLDAARSLVSPRMALTMAKVGERKAWRRLATAWLSTYAEVAAYGLVPPTLGAAKSDRSIAERAILTLVRLGKESVVRKVAKAYGKDASRGIDALLARGPLAFAGPIPKSPEFLHVEDLPPVTLKGGKKATVALGAEATAALVEMLKLGTPDEPYPGVALAREALDPGSVGDLAVELLEQWVIGDAPGRHDWMLFAVLAFPSERGMRRIAELAREWARKNAAKCERACVALATEGSDAALMHLAHIADTSRFVGLRAKAAELLKDAAQARGLAPAELEDRTVPDAGLGADGTLVLSYGPREFVVTVDGALRPVVRERQAKGALGEPAKTLPRPAKTDDAAKAKDARERFDALRKDLETVGKRQVRRLERAMVEGRTWPAADFTSRIVTHPLLRHLAPGLVWETVAKNGASVATFRIAEDGSFADDKDRPFTLARTATVRLAHPARSGSLATWATLFGDYTIVQPFEQLGRPVEAPSVPERKASTLARASGLSVPARKILGTLESRGWRRDDSGQVSSWLRDVAIGGGKVVTARWPIDPPIAIEDLRHADPVRTEPLVVEDGDGKGVALGKLDPVAFSELIRDVEAVAGLS